MATSDNIKSTVQPALRDTKSTLREATHSASSGAKEKIDSLKATADRFASDTTPRVREALDQVSEVASDLYNRANSWISQGNNKNYGLVALVATVGILGFVLGHSLNTSSNES
jgi:ElaB/YqjD/DUF883 family membrane-anchored ribosome-binding protein